MSEWTKAVEVVAQVIDDEGGRPGSSLHSWRCEYPDRYGECSCVAEMAEEVVKALRTTGLLADPTTRTEPSIRIDIDQSADAAYIRLSDKAVARTVELTDDVYVDLDNLGVAVGIEILSLDRGHTIVRRTVTDWTPAEDRIERAGGEE